MAVALENFIFFASRGEDLGWDDEEIEEVLDSESMSVETEVLPPIEQLRLVAWLRDQPGPGRSPFLTLLLFIPQASAQALHLRRAEETLQSG